MASRCARSSAVQRRLGALERVLGKGTDGARTILRGLVGEITLKPTPEGLKAQLRGNIKGLLSFNEQAPVFLRLVAGACNPRYTVGPS